MPSHAAVRLPANTPDKLTTARAINQSELPVITAVQERTSLGKAVKKAKDQPLSLSLQSGWLGW
jgi:hypothetical protein